MSSSLSVAEIPTIAALYRLGRLPLNSTSSSKPDQSFNNAISLLRADITTLRVDAIVNAANNTLLGGGGVDGAIHRAAGPSLVAECETLDGCDTGSANITDAYNLPCKKVIHAVGPVYHSTKKYGKHEQLLRGCYRRSLELAVDNGLKSVAFSAISTGVYGYPSMEAAEVACREVRNFIEESGREGRVLERVIFCCFLEKDEKAYEECIPKFFPPTETDLASGDAASSSDHSESLAARLPSVPTGAPAEEGQPEAKKQKTTHITDTDDWEKVEKDGQSAGNGSLDTELPDVDTKRQAEEVIEKGRDWTG